jgi:hypothetical protein
MGGTSLRALARSCWWDSPWSDDIFGRILVATVWFVASEMAIDAGCWLGICGESYVMTA